MTSTNSLWVSSTYETTASPAARRNRARTFKRATTDTYVGRSFDELYDLKPANSWVTVYN